MNKLKLQEPGKLAFVDILIEAQKKDESASSILNEEMFMGQVGLFYLRLLNRGEPDILFPT